MILENLVQMRFFLRSFQITFLTMLFFVILVFSWSLLLEDPHSKGYQLLMVMENRVLNEQVVNILLQLLVCFSLTPSLLFSSKIKVICSWSGLIDDTSEFKAIDSSRNCSYSCCNFFFSRRLSQSSEKWSWSLF